MDPNAFDEVARSIASSGTRRGLLRAGLAVLGGIAGLGLADHAGAAVKRRAGEICRKHGDCASGVCGAADATGRRRCLCGGGADCPTSANLCVSAVCTNGVCDTAPVQCNDNNVCTLDSCDPAVGCVHTPVSCNDNNACTIDTCDPAQGCIFTRISCDDGDVCTIDTCDATSGCQNTPISCGTGSDGTTCCGHCPSSAPCCNGGVCGACPPIDPGLCPHGVTTATLVDGTVIGAQGGAVCVSPCTSDADCPCEFRCVSSFQLCLPGTPSSDCSVQFAGAGCAAMDFRSLPV